VSKSVGVLSVLSSCSQLDEAFDSAGYEVTKDEEEDDAEVNFSGGSPTSQVKMIQRCKDRTGLTITIRPQ